VRPTGLDEVVVPGALIVGRDAPLAGDEAALLEAAERLVEGAVANTECTARAGFEPLGDLEAVPLTSGRVLDTGPRVRVQSL